MTTQEVALQLGVSPTTINQVELGNGCRRSTAARIVEGLATLGVEILGEAGWTGARLRLKAEHGD